MIIVKLCIRLVLVGRGRGFVCKTNKSIREKARVLMPSTEGKEEMFLKSTEMEIEAEGSF